MSKNFIYIRHYAFENMQECLHTEATKSSSLFLQKESNLLPLHMMSNADLTSLKSRSQEF